MRRGLIKDNHQPAEGNKALTMSQQAIKAW